MSCEPRGVATLLEDRLDRRPVYIAEGNHPARQATATRMGRRGLVLGSLLALAGVTLPAGIAQAHSRLVKSDPTARAVLAAAPKEVRLWFNEQVEPAFAKIWIAPTEGEPIPLQSRGDASDKHLLVATLPPSVPEGPVVIGFHVLSVDGHTIEDKLVFTIKKPA